MSIEKQMGKAKEKEKEKEVGFALCARAWIQILGKRKIAEHTLMSELDEKMSTRLACFA